MEITNEIKAKVMSPYIGQKVTTPIREYKGEGQKSNYVNGTLMEIDLGMDEDFMGVLLDNESDKCNYKYFNSNESKVKLTPLSSITDEHAIEMAVEIGYMLGLFTKEELIIHGRTFARLLFAYPTNTTEFVCYKGIVKLQQLGYDLNHPLLNGQTLKEAGIAIYKTT